MYEYVKTERGWLLCWGPPPATIRPAQERPNTTLPAHENQPDKCLGVAQPSHGEAGAARQTA